MHVRLAAVLPIISCRTSGSRGVLIWLLLRREMGVKAAIASARWVVPVSFFLSAIVIYLGASSYQWGIL